MGFRSENFVFKFLQRGVDGAWAGCKLNKARSVRKKADVEKKRLIFIPLEKSVEDKGKEIRRNLLEPFACAIRVSITLVK